MRHLVKGQPKGLFFTFLHRALGAFRLLHSADNPHSLHDSSAFLRRWYSVYGICFLLPRRWRRLFQQCRPLSPSSRRYDDGRLGFLTQTAAFAIAGFLGTLADVPANSPSTLSAPIYAHAFNSYGLISMILAIVSFLLVHKLKKLIRG